MSENNCAVVIWKGMGEVPVKKISRSKEKLLAPHTESTPKHPHSTTKQPLQQATSSLTADYSFSYDEVFFFFFFCLPKVTLICTAT